MGSQKKPGLYIVLRKGNDLKRKAPDPWLLTLPNVQKRKGGIELWQQKENVRIGGVLLPSQ